ncbi:MAG TPA: ketoacyl-ACP synthase III [Pseudobdellovibrionaceae bacterium]|nr:ketoacyl-ACP synthase III [Pseudobdellovibrionaceae bacterium]
MRAVICGLGLYAPPNVVENSFFDQKYNRDMTTFLRDQRNIAKRHFMSADQATSDLILPAAEQAMKRAGLTARDLDLIIVATDTPDYVSPSTAAVVQHKLQATRAGTFDINTACAGFATGTEIASKFLMADERYQHILVVGAYGMSKYFDWDDYKVTSVFADGAGAAILRRATPAEEAGGLGILASQLATEGQYHDYMGIYAGGTKFPISTETVNKKMHLLQFTKRIPPETNGRIWPELTHALLDRVGAKVGDVKHFFFTQINIGSIVETMRKLQAPQERAHNIMDQYGYTGSACLPMALADAAEKHKLKRGDLVIVIGSGGGMSMAALAMRWAYDT